MSKEYDYVLGQNSYDCGIASIMTILMYYGIKHSREKIISKLNKKYNGYTAYDLIKIAKEYQIEAYGIKESINNIKKLPAIAHTIKDKNMFHFIVILEINSRKDQIKIMDPSFGIKTISFEEFNSITTNIFLIFEGEKKKKIRNKRFKREIIRVFQTNRRIILKTLFLSFVYVLLSLSFNYYLKTVLTYKNSMSIIFTVFIIFLNISILKNFISYIKNRLVLNLSIKIDKEITDNVSNHILNLPYEYFISKTTGELVTIVEDIENFKQIVTKIFILSLVDLILIGVIIIYLLFINIYISISFIIMITFILLITKKYQYPFNDTFIKLKNSKIQYTASLINYFTSFETIKNLNISKKITDILSKKYEETLVYDKTYSKKYYNYEIIISFLLDFFYLFLILITSLLVIETGINFLDIVLFSSIFYLVTGLLSNINESISLYKVYQTTTDRILDCMDVPEEKFNKTNHHRINSIEFKDVSYKTDNISILNDINLKIGKGDKVYISGNSGIGKSTLMKILLCYYKMSKGKVLIDNIDINDFDLSFIRENITYISQNESLFPGTILSNLNLISTSKDEIDKISSITLLDIFMGNNNIDYNFPVEENGNNLSGGERKKMILARGLLKFKEVLILDEVFNEISIEEERKILTVLFDEYKDKIIIMISHRNSNKDLFNKKYKIEGDGKIYEVK